MKEIKYTITDPEGIHARPAGLLVKEANQFTSSIKISKDGSPVDAKRIFAVMGLAAKQGQTITITVDGSDEQAAAAQLEVFLKANL